MFFFGKKKKEKKQEQAVPVVNKEELIAKASEKVTELESKTGDERVSLLNEIGSLYTQAEYPRSIAFFSASTLLQ